jgi:hypothetical protein
MTDGKKSLPQPADLREILYYGISPVGAARRSLQAPRESQQHRKALYRQAILTTVRTYDTQSQGWGQRGDEEGGEEREEKGEITSIVISLPACWHHACPPPQRSKKEVF